MDLDDCELKNSFLGAAVVDDFELLSTHHHYLQVPMEGLSAFTFILVSRVTHG